MAISDRPWEIPWEKWQCAQIPVERLDQIAAVTNARNSNALRRKTVPTYPMDVALLLGAVVFEGYKQRLRYDTPPTPKQRKQTKRVAEITRDLEFAINTLDEPTRFRLRNAFQATLPTAEIRSLFNAASSTAIPLKKKTSNRPVHSFKNRSLELLIHGLYGLIVVNSQGQLTLWEDRVAGGLKGTLPAVLELLRPYLHGILPKRIPFSTLNRALSRAKRAHSS